MRGHFKIRNEKIQILVTMDINYAVDSDFKSTRNEALESAISVTQGNIMSIFGGAKPISRHIVKKTPYTVIRRKFLKPII